MPKFKTGEKRPENAGRKKGSLNKKTVLLQEILEAASYCPVEEILKILNEKNPKKMLMPSDRVRFNLELMSYIYPKRKAIEVRQESSGKIQFISKDELNEAKRD